jgi:hypothetical protein
MLILWLAVWMPEVLLGQVPVDVSQFSSRSGATVNTANNQIAVNWPINENKKGNIKINLDNAKPLFESIGLTTGAEVHTVIKNQDPAFILTVGKRDLVSQNGWNIFFDSTPYKPHQAYVVKLDKDGAKVTSNGSRTNISISGLSAGGFKGHLEITLYNGSPLLNIAAVVSTDKDSTAIIYDAGLVSSQPAFEKVAWSDTDGYLQGIHAEQASTATNVKVKYRAISGENAEGSVAIFPPPHQYFPPLDNAFNLRFTWYGKGYRDLVPQYGIGIRNELMGDMRWVPWFNAPPNTLQRLNFFLLLSTQKGGRVIDEVKKFTHNDSYKSLDGFYTLASHFHTEHTDDVLTHKPLPEVPGFVKALKKTGVNIMHLGEFHLAGNPKDPGPRRLIQYKTMFQECERLSSGNFLMLPGEEPNNFFGGHWMNLFPKPVYWIMDRQKGQPFLEDVPGYGKVYRVGDKNDMLGLLKSENGLAWTAHARTKGSVGYPDKYKDEEFYKSDRFLGAAWKSLPADLSQPRLGKRALDVMDDMANWGFRKHVIGEADIFKLEPDYEVYGHLNVNYLQLDKLPEFKDGWQPVLTALEQGKFFVSTGEVLLPRFTVNGKGSGEVLKISKDGKAEVQLDVDWTFPLSFAEIISGDGNQVFRQRVDLSNTEAFGKQSFKFQTNLKNKTWLRVEVWDVASNGAFTQQIWLE